LFRYNETTEQLDPLWEFSWDPIHIADLGGEIAALIGNFGSQSGLHTFSPVDGHQYVSAEGGLWGIWADPVSHAFGNYYPTRNLVVRLVSDSQSIIFREQDYSIDGGLSYAPLGVRSDGVEMRIRDAYIYQAPYTVIFLAHDHPGESLLIGKLGGTFYPFDSLELSDLHTLFYSQRSRLLIVGNDNNLFSAILPEPGWMAPTLSINSATIISWPTQYSAGTLESSASLKGSWQEVTAPRLTIGGNIQVAVPADSSAKFFRLLLP